MAHYIGLDLGGTNLKAGVVDERGTPVAKLSVPSEAERGPDRVLAVMADAASAVAERANMSLDEIVGIGVGAPGPVDFDSGIVLAAPNLPGWTNIAVSDRISAATGRPCILENDANAAAMGEFWAGAGRDPAVRHLIMLTLGTGIGSGIIINGRMLHGAHGYGGEVGHIVIDPDGPRWTSGTPGAFEGYASAASTGRRAAELIRAGGTSALAAVLDRKGELSAEDVFDAAKAGDALAERVVNEVTRCLGMVCVNLCRLFDPQMIVFAGGMILAGEYLFERVRRWFNHFDWTILKTPVRIEAAQLGNDAGIIGAAAGAWDAHETGRWR